MAEMTKDMYGAAGRVGRKSWQEELATRVCQRPFQLRAG